MHSIDAFMAVDKIKRFHAQVGNYFMRFNGFFQTQTIYFHSHNNAD